MILLKKLLKVYRRSEVLLMKAEEVLKIIKEMENSERNKLLEQLAYEYFGKKRYTPEEIRKLNYIAMYGDETEEE